MAPNTHVSEELANNPARATVQTKHGPVIGGVASNNCIVFLEIPYALPPKRFEDPQRLPDDFRYADKEYIYESAYAYQPENDGQAAGTPPQDKLGFGLPSENPLFLNIFKPTQQSNERKLPVRVYIHGGFLQFGSPHGLSSQAQYIAVERNEIWVNIGYRLSAFGFLASDDPKVPGNFGFKDQWLALEWVKDNIAVFNGDVDNIQISGLSAGAHSVHQMLHFASRLPEGRKAPFQRAVMQSNAIIHDGKTLQDLQAQFNALCTALHLEPGSADALEQLRDPQRIKPEAIQRAIKDDLLVHGTFRACVDGEWISSNPGPTQRQTSGEFAKGLLKAGVKSVVIGDLIDEWYLYSIAHPIASPEDIRLNTLRYFPADFVDALLKCYPQVGVSATPEECVKLFGEIMSDAQVHVPIRQFARDMVAAGFPVLRYEIRWTPEQAREPHGFVTHGSDRILWTLRKPGLSPEQWQIAKDWVDRIDREVAIAESSGNAGRTPADILTLTEDKKFEWRRDWRWDRAMDVLNALPSY